ncbi:MAG: hypothetical protein JWR26_2322 [Pedosphaera sp.]|nr:hypothetical protein [Pedosphaera sp.]
MLAPPGTGIRSQVGFIGKLRETRLAGRTLTLIDQRCPRFIRPKPLHLKRCSILSRCNPKGQLHIRRGPVLWHLRQIIKGACISHPIRHPRETSVQFPGRFFPVQKTQPAEKSKHAQTFSSSLAKSNGFWPTNHCQSAGYVGPRLTRRSGFSRHAKPGHVVTLIHPLGFLFPHAPWRSCVNTRVPGGSPQGPRAQAPAGAK